MVKSDVNIILAMVVLLVVVGLIAVRLFLLDPDVLRRLAAWATGEALYREHVAAEKARGRELAQDLQRKTLVQFGLIEVAAEVEAEG